VELPRKLTKVTIDGVEYKVTPSDFNITGRNDNDLKFGAGKLMFYTRLAARARKNVALLDAEYHNWKATELERIASSKGKERIAEWRAKNSVEANPTIVTYKRKLARLREVVETVDGWVRSMEEKINLLRTARADSRKERDVAGEIDPLSDKKGRENGVRDALRKGRK
jgi:hypothetical protein